MLTDVINDINKKYKFKIVGNIQDKKKNYKKITSTTPAISYLFHGDIPRTIMILVGEASSGKSSLSYMLCGQAQKALQKEYDEEVQSLDELQKPTKEQQQRLEYLKTRGPQKVAYLDIEFTTNEEWLIKNGVDIDELILILPENQTAEELFQICLDLIDSDGIGFMVLDSVPALVSQQAADKTMSEKTYGGISQPMTTFCSKLLPKCNKHGTGFIFVAQPREDLSGYHRLLFTGGKMLKHTSSITLALKRGAYIDESFNELKSHPEEAAGNLVEVEVIKNKVTKPDRKMAKFTIEYDNGITGINDTIIMAIGLGIIIKTGSWFNMGEEKWQGKKSVVEYFKNNNKKYEQLKQLVMQEVIK